TSSGRLRSRVLAAAGTQRRAHSSPTPRSSDLAGRTEVALDFDDSLFSGPALHDTWESSYLNGGYVAPITALGVHLGARRTDVPYPPRYLDPARHAADVFAERLAGQGVLVRGSPR